MSPRLAPRLVLLLTLLALPLLGCSDAEEASPPPATPAYSAQPRAASDRTPRTAPCDEADPRRCLLPWPSNTFTRADSTSPTGLRLAIQASSLYSDGDDPASLNAADGFSRVSPLATMFLGEVADLPVAADGRGPIRLIVAQHDAPGRGSLVPLRYSVHRETSSDSDLPESLILAFPLAPLAPASDHVAVILDELPVGTPQVASRHTRLALALDAPQSQQEAELQAYHAPTRAVLTEANIDPARVLRVWNFTTRSEDDPKKRLRSMREAAVGAVAGGKVKAAIDKVELKAEGPIAAVVEGHLAGLPLFADPSPGSALTPGEGGLPQAKGEHDAPFRVTIPAGQGDYRAVIFGHGTGGSFKNNDFDTDLAAQGLAKVSIDFYGWTESDVIDTFTGFSKMAVGSHHSSARLMQAIADGAAIEAALEGPIAGLLAAEQLGGQANPAAGRKPDRSIPVWVGGSLGGTMGAVFTGSSPHTFAGVFNVGGGAWTHFIPGSAPFNIINVLLKTSYGGNLNVLAAIALGQGNWDDIDGATWSAELRRPKNTFLVQESIGDPVLPNPGTEMLSRVVGAKMVGQALVPVPGLELASKVDAGSALTQYRVANTGQYDVHGFAARSGPGGVAARQQIFEFLTSVWAGSPTITPPSACPAARCDFSAP